jgi:hypothetical protein
MPHVINLRDFKHYSGHIVLNGQGFMISRPTVPHFLLYDYEELFRREQKRCAGTEEKYKVKVNDIIASPACQVKRILLLFPDGMTCNDDDMGATTPSSIDQKVNLILRPLAIDTTIKKGSAMVFKNQSFCPGYWALCVINDNSCILKCDEEGDDNDLEKAFAGMHV